MKEPCAGKTTVAPLFIIELERGGYMAQYQVRNLAEGNGNKGRYLMDYSRKYQPPYDVAEKAAQHISKLKKVQENKKQCFSKTS